MNEKVIVLPDRAEMLARLLGVSDDSHLSERFFPILLRHAGQTRNAHGIVLTLLLAIHDYTEGMPVVMEAVLMLMLPALIRALVIDTEVADAAQALVGALDEEATDGN